MANQFYEERIPIPRFSLHYNEYLKYLLNAIQNIQVDGKDNSLLFLHIKSLDVSNMRMRFMLPDNDKTPELCFVVYERDETTNNIVRQFVHIVETRIFDSGDSSSSLDRFVELINRCINYFVKEAKNIYSDINCKLLYGNFTIEENTLQYKYLNEKHGNTQKRLQYLVSTVCLLILF